MSGQTVNAIASAFRRMAMLVGVGRIQIGNDAGLVQMQQIQLNANDTRDNTPRVAEYGFTSMPKPGCHAIFLCVGGNRSNGVIVGTNDPAARLKNLQPGEVAIYDDLGQSVYLTRAGIVVEGAGLPITVNGATTIKGPLHVTGPITGDSTITAPNVVGTTDVQFGTHLGTTHVHSGVSTGVGNTGGPI